MTEYRQVRSGWRGRFKDEGAQLRNKLVSCPAELMLCCEAEREARLGKRWWDPATIHWGRRLSSRILKDTHESGVTNTTETSPLTDPLPNSLPKTKSKTNKNVMQI
jgi:hypothetical protein